MAGALTDPRTLTGVFKKTKNFGLFILALIVSLVVGTYVSPTWTVEKVTLDVQEAEGDKLYYIYRGKPKYLEGVLSYQDAHLNPEKIRALNAAKQSPGVQEEFTYRIEEKGRPISKNLLSADSQASLGILVFASSACCRIVLLADP